MPSKASKRAAVWIGLALLALVLGLVASLRFELETLGPPLRLVFTGFENSGKTATFAITNTESSTILLFSPEKEVKDGTKWHLGDGFIWFDKGGPSYAAHSLIKPGMHLKIMVRVRPSESHWRLVAIASRKGSFMEEVRWKVRTAWDTKRLSNLWRSGIWAGPSQTVQSEEISN